MDRLIFIALSLTGVRIRHALLTTGHPSLRRCILVLLGDTLPVPNINSGWQGGEQGAALFLGSGVLGRPPAALLLAPRRCCTLQFIMEICSGGNDPQARTAFIISREEGKPSTHCSFENITEAITNRKCPFPSSKQGRKIIKTSTKMEGAAAKTSQSVPRSVLAAAIMNVSNKNLLCKTLRGKSDAVRQEAAICCRRTSESVRRRRRRWRWW